MHKPVPQEIKQEIISKVKSGRKLVDVADQYGVSDKSIYNWMRADTGETVISIHKYNKLKRENDELKRIIGTLTLDMSLGEKKWAGQIISS